MSSADIGASSPRRRQETGKQVLKKAEKSGSSEIVECKDSRDFRFKRHWLAVLLFVFCLFCFFYFGVFFF